MRREGVGVLMGTFWLKSGTEKLEKLVVLFICFLSFRL